MGSVDQAQITGFLCRLCSKMHRMVIHIYGYEGMKYKLEQKINNYLPVTVTPTDLLPKTICKPCLSRVEQHHRLMMKIAQNHLKFQKLQSSSARITRLRNRQTTSGAASTSSSNSNLAGEEQDDTSSASSSNTDSITTGISTNEMSIIANIDSTINDDDDESLLDATSSD